MESYKIGRARLKELRSRSNNDEFKYELLPLPAANFINFLASECTERAYGLRSPLSFGLRGKKKVWDGLLLKDFLFNDGRTNDERLEYKGWLQKESKFAISTLDSVSSEGASVETILDWFRLSAIYDNEGLEAYIESFVKFAKKDDREFIHAFARCKPFVNSVLGEEDISQEPPDTHSSTESKTIHHAPFDDPAQTERAWVLTSKEVTAPPYEDFIKRYPNSIQSKSAERHLSDISKWERIKRDDPDAIRAFIKEGPFEHLGDIARNLIEPAKKSYADKKVKHVLSRMTEPEGTFLEGLGYALFYFVSFILLLIYSFVLSVGMTRSGSDLSIVVHNVVLQGLKTLGGSGAFEFLKIPGAAVYFSDENHELAYAVIYIPLGCLIFFGILYFIISFCIKSLSASQAKQEAEIRAYHESGVQRLTTRGAGPYFCGSCLAERPFYGTFEGEALSGMGSYTLGLSFIIKECLRHSLYKPVCVECGSRLDWAAQKFLSGGQVAEKGEADSQKITARFVKSFGATALGCDPGIEGLGYEFHASQKQKNDTNNDGKGLRVEWDFASANITDTAGGLAGKVAFRPAYILRSIFSSDQKTLVALHDAYNRGLGNQWISLYRAMGFCIFPRGLPKWREVARREVRSTDSNNPYKIQLLHDQNLMIFASAFDVVVFDLSRPSNSVVVDLERTLHNRVQHLWINEIYIARSGTGIVFSGTQYISQKQQQKIAAILDVNSERLEIFSGEREDVFKVLDDCENVVLIRRANELLLFNSASWKSMDRIAFKEEITEARITSDRQHIVVRLNANKGNTPDLEAVEKKSKAEVTYSIYEIISDSGVEIQ